MGKPKIVGIGELLWDVLPAGRRLGGAPVNFAFYAQEQGAEACIVSAVGQDASGDELLGGIAALGLGVRAVQRNAHPTSTVEVTLDAAGVPAYRIREQVAWDYIERTAEADAAVAGAAVVCWGSLAQRNAVSRRTILALVDAAPVIDIAMKLYGDAAEAVPAAPLADPLPLAPAAAPVTPAPQPDRKPEPPAKPAAPRYDAATDRVLAETSTAPRPSLARFLRRVVAINAHRPELVQMFSTLSAEALDPEHPAHDYFAQRERSSVRAALQVPWAAPPSVDARDVLESGLCLMDGLQLRWLRDPGQDLNAMWRRCERTLMPSPLWDNYR